MTRADRLHPRRARHWRGRASAWGSNRDALFPGAEHRGPDPDVVTAEIAMWRNGGNCQVSVYIQPNAGHVGLFHRTSKQLTDRILDWLDHHDL